MPSIDDFNDTRLPGGFERLLTGEEVGMITRLPVSTIYQHARDGVIPCVRFGRRVRFEQQAIRDFIARGGTGAA